LRSVSEAPVIPAGGCRGAVPGGLSGEGAAAPWVGAMVQSAVVAVSGVGGTVSGTGGTVSGTGVSVPLSVEGLHSAGPFLNLLCELGVG
jgi:hypothetical protein